jgi:hypothetical protein
MKKPIIITMVLLVLFAGAVSIAFGEAVNQGGNENNGGQNNEGTNNNGGTNNAGVETTTPTCNEMTKCPGAVITLTTGLTDTNRYAYLWTVSTSAIGSPAYKVYTTAGQEPAKNGPTLSFVVPADSYFDGTKPLYVTLSITDKTVDTSCVGYSCTKVIISKLDGCPTVGDICKGTSPSSTYKFNPTCAVVANLEYKWLLKNGNSDVTPNDYKVWSTHNEMPINWALTQFGEGTYTLTLYIRNKGVTGDTPSFICGPSPPFKVVNTPSFTISSTG